MVAVEAFVVTDNLLMTVIDGVSYDGKDDW